MPRKLRLQYPGAMCPVMSRGDRWESIILDDLDRQDFVKMLAEAGQKAGGQDQAYISEELSWLVWSPAELAARRKNDPVKLALVARLRQETTLSIKAIAAQVHLGTSKSASARQHQFMTPLPPSDPRQGQLRI